jgi:hypothetical protein
MRMSGRHWATVMRRPLWRLRLPRPLPAGGVKSCRACYMLRQRGAADVLLGLMLNMADTLALLCWLRVLVRQGRTSVVSHRTGCLSLVQLLD